MRAKVRVADGFLGALQTIEDFLTAQGATDAFASLMADLSATVVPNLESFPEIGAPFFERLHEPLRSQQVVRRRLRRYRPEQMALRAGRLSDSLSGDGGDLYAALDPPPPPVLVQSAYPCPVGRKIADRAVVRGFQGFAAPPLCAKTAPESKFNNFSGETE